MGMKPNDIKTFDEIVKHLNNLIKNLTNTKSELVREQNKNKQLENDKSHAGIQNTLDKRNELAKEVENKNNIISNRDKSIQKLELKNEKLTGSYKKLIQHFANARQLITNLQKDLEDKDEKTYKLEKEISLLKIGQNQNQEYIVFYD
ncbi:16130_t:CDS:2 [Funneliformis geosporum]|nr:16130_t:CDS:2 [Funneliformis geosporum]